MSSDEEKVVSIWYEDDNWNMLAYTKSRVEGHLIELKALQLDYELAWIFFEFMSELDKMSIEED